MKKNSFIQGAMVATIGIIITKILGVIFVIPFFAIIGQKGGALYSYTYVIYSIFLSLSTIGIPLAVSKLTSEYDALGDYHLKERAFKIAQRLLMTFSIISFLILIIFAPQLAELFIGDIQGGNTISDIAFTIRMVSTGVLIVPALAVTRGYLQGHKFITPSAISQVIEQLVRVFVLLVGSYLCIYVFHLGLRIAVGVAVFAATVGAIGAYLYLWFKIEKNRHLLRKDSEIKREEVRIKTKDIIKKIVIYSVPFIISGLVVSFFNLADLVTINKTMVTGLHYSVKEAEAVSAIISNWTSKIEMVILAVGMGLTASLVPTMTDSFVKKNFDDIRNKINKSLKVLLYAVTPMTVGLSLLAAPVWTFFFGYSHLANFIFQYNTFTAFFLTLLSTLNIIFQSINENKKMLIYLSIGVAIKFLFNIPLMYTFNSYGMHPSYGPSTATIIGFLVSSVLILISLHKKLKVNYDSTFKRFLDILYSTLIMAVVMVLLQIFIPVDTHSRIGALLLALFYTAVGGAIYIFITIKNGVLYDIFGSNILHRVLVRLKLKKAE